MSGAAGGGGAGAAVRQGHLRKLKTMKKKYFVLRAESGDCGARLEYYESEKKCRAGAAPRRVLPLSSCYNITRRLDLKQKHVIALFTSDEQFCVVAENEHELHAWLAQLLKLHQGEDSATSEDLLHPIQHVWQVNVQKKGLGAVKNIHGLYNLCLTDKTLSLVKIKSHNNVISELGIPERIEYSLKNIRRCGDSECFFYMEVGRQTTTGAGELWMHSEDSNIAQSMHSTILHAMRNCAKDSENERDHIVIPKNEGGPPARRQTYSDGRGRAGLTSESVLCVGACIRQCVCAGTLSIDESGAALPPLAPYAESNNTLTEGEGRAAPAGHQRTVSLGAAVPAGSPLRVVHGRTRSAPLTGDELHTVLGRGREPAECEPARKPAGRRASTGMRLSKLSPAHSKNAGTLRNRCDSMPSRAVSAFEIERPPQRHNDIEGADASRDEPDAVSEWLRTPRIPEEPDLCDINRELNNMSMRGGGSYQHSRTSSLGVEDADTDGYLAMAPHETPDGYLPMGPLDSLGGLVSASSGSVCSGTPSTDPRFSEYQLDPATMHIGCEARPPRAYSVGSRPAPRAEARHRAYSVGARARPPPPAHAPPRARASHDDLMLLDFTPGTKHPSPSATPTGTPGAAPAGLRTPPCGPAPAARSTDEYVDMSPRNAGYVEMRPGEMSTPTGSHATPATPATPATDGYVEMTYGKSRPIAIAAARAPPPPAAASPDDRFRRLVEARPAHGSQIFEFSGSLESPLSPHAPEDEPRHLATVREAAEDAPRTRDPRHRESRCGEPFPSACGGGGVSCSPQYVTLKPGEGAAPPHAAPSFAPAPPRGRTDGDENVPAECKFGAPVVLAGAGCSSGAARFTVPSPGASGAPPSPSFTCAPLNYAALDLEPRRAPQAPQKRTYTQIDFVRSEKLHAGDAT